MLVAKTSTGQLFSVARQENRNYLLELREKEGFFCPCCQEKVILKLGLRRAFHFSHLKNSKCKFLIEPESPYHIAGKLQLLELLQSHQLEPILEPYLAEIKQRPDLLVELAGEKYAIEYQCSPISEEIFNKRTRTYLNNGYKVIWILGANLFKQRSGNRQTISNFLKLFLKDFDEGMGLSFYCSRERILLQSQIFTMIKGQEALIKVSTTKLQKIDISQLFHKQISTLSTQDQYKLFKSAINFLNSFKQNYCLNRYFHTDPFLKEIYNLHLSIPQLPQSIGLPCPSSIFLHKAPLVWQSYIIIDNFLMAKSGQIIYLEDIYNNFNKRIVKQEIKVQKSSFFTNKNHLAAVKEYLDLLEKYKYIEKIDYNTYKYIKKILSPSEGLI